MEIGQSLRRVSSCVIWAIIIASTLLVIGCNSISSTPTLLVVPQTLTIHPGDQNVQVTVIATGSSYKGSIPVKLSGLPSGITADSITLAPGQTTGTFSLSATVAADQEGFQSNVPSASNTDTVNVSVLGYAGTAITSTFQMTVSLSNPSYTPAPSSINLPILTINTNGVAIVNKTTDVPGTVTITSADGQTSYLPNAGDTDNTATFHLHGNSTEQMPKKPYHVKLNTSLDLLTTMGLGCPYTTGKKPVCDKSKSYVLLANYDDKTLLRDWSAAALANAIPMGKGYLTSPAGSPSPSGTSTLVPWAAHSLFVELFLNGQYEGNYQLIEEVKVDSHRVNITELTETDTAPADVTGGYLLEIDPTYHDEAFVFTTPGGVVVGLDDPDFTPDPEVPQQTSYISTYVSTAETALLGPNFTDPTAGWRAYYDEASAVNWYIVNDMMENVDAGDFASSDYVYKDKNNPLLYMGPIWDFDTSAGNSSYIPGPPTSSTPWAAVQNPWYRRWFQDPGFAADVATQWNKLKSEGVFDAWIASIQAEAATLEQSQKNNFGRWPMQGIIVFPNQQAAGSYEAEVSYFLNWVQQRMAYLDAVLNGRTPTSTTIMVLGGELRTGKLTTLKARVSGPTSLSGTVTWLVNNKVRATTTIDGSGTAELAVLDLPAGRISLQATYNGSSVHAFSASKLVTAVVLPAVSSAGTF
jgi:CotH kinase protein/Bacterial Ig-like domain (group 3)